MQEIPTDKHLLDEIRSISKSAPHLMMCSNCAKYNPANGECAVNHMRFPPYVRGCGGKDFITNEELLLAKVKKELMSQVEDVEKIENMLALLISTACAASCFAEDLERRLKTMRKMPSYEDKKSNLRKDLDLVEGIKGALDKINKTTNDMAKSMNAGLEKIDQQYRLFIEHHINRLFTEGGRFDVKKADGNLNNAMIICNVIGKFVQKCIGNKENFDAFFKMLNGLKNDAPYGLTDDDFKHYELKEYD